jgi:hypothetical protein
MLFKTKSIFLLGTEFAFSPLMAANEEKFLRPEYTILIADRFLFKTGGFREKRRQKH